MDVPIHQIYHNDPIMSTPRKTSGASAVNLAVVANDVEHMKTDVSDIKQVLGQMSASLTGLTRIEERQIAVVSALERGDTAMAGHEDRIKIIETEMPQLREMRKWVIKGVSAGVGMMFLGLCSMVAGTFADRYIPKQYVQTLVSSPNAIPPAANPQ